MARRRGITGAIALLCVLAAGWTVLRGFGDGAHPLIPGIASQAAQAAEAALPPVPTSDADWRPAKLLERKAVTSSIAAQLEAFRKDDYDKAVIYQSSGLRQNFPSVDAFRSMMKHSYPQFTTYKTVQFGPVRMSKDGQYSQVPVILTAKDGSTIRAMYLMVLENKLFRVESVLGGASPDPEPLTTEGSRLT